MTKITTDFVGTESAATTRTRLTEILSFWGFDPAAYTTWGNARTDMNIALSGSSFGQIGASELAGSFLPKINGLNDAEFAISYVLGIGAAQMILHPLEYGSMFQDRAGTTPVTESGQLVGRVLDAGPGGYHAEAVSDAARGVFRDVGGFRYIEYNGVNTAYQTPVLPSPGVDKAQLFSGLRKISDATTGIMAELSVSLNTNPGSFFLAGPTGANPNYIFVSKGSIPQFGAGGIASGFAAPISNVISGIGDIAGDSSTLRVDGAQVALNTADQGTGNYNPSGTHRLFYGARGGTSTFFNGYHYATLGPIVRFSAANATPQQIALAEAYFTGRTDL
jgi:hypothetical protein